MFSFGKFCTSCMSLSDLLKCLLNFNETSDDKYVTATCVASLHTY